MQPARSSRGARRFDVAHQVAAGFVLGVVVSAAVVVGVILMSLHDHAEVQGLPNFQLWCAAGRFQDAAKLSGGTFPESGDEARRLLAPSPAHELDPWGEPFRYERLGDGRRARVFTLGEDDEPGGGWCDADIVVWFDAQEAHTTWDVRMQPAAWGAAKAAQGSDAPGRR
jgi:hypothetical protein